MPTEVCLNDYYLTPRNTPYLVIQIIAKIIFLFQLTRCEAYALTTFSNTSLVSSYKVLLCLKTSSSPQHYSHTFLFKITPTPLLSTPLFNNLNPVYLVCWSQHLLDTLTDIVPILTYRSLFSSLLLPANTSSTISSSSLANNSTVCRKSHFLVHIWFAKDCYVGRPFWHNPPWALAWDQGSPNKWLSAKNDYRCLYVLWLIFLLIVVNMLQ